MKKSISNPPDENKTLEELQGEVDHAKTLKDRVDALRVLCQQATRLKSADPLQFAGKELLTIGEETNDSDIQADGYQALGTAAHFITDFDQAKHYYNLSIKLNEQNEDKFGLARNFNSMGIAYYDLDDNVKALEFYERALLLNKEIGRKEGEASVTGNIGSVYSHFGDYAKALDYFERAIRLYEELGLKYGVAMYISNIGDVYDAIGDFEKGLKYLYQALSLFDELDMKYSSATIKTNIGSVHYKLSDFTKALFYQEQSFRESQELDIKDAVALAKLNMGLAYQALGDNQKAFACFEYAYDIFMKFDAKGHAGVALGNIAFAYSKVGDNTKALEYYERAVAMLRQIGWKSQLPIFLCSIGTIYFRKEYEHYNPEKAESYLLESESLCLELGIKYELIEIYKTLSAFYEQTGKSEEALKYLKMSIDIEKKVFSEESKKRIDVFNMRLAIADKELQTEKQKSQIIKLEQQLTSQATHLATQTEMLGNFRNEMRQIVREINEPIAALKKIKEKLKELPCDSVDWVKFEKEFTAVHPEFRAKLTRKYPELTKQEIKMCQLARLGLKTYEMSRLLCLSERTIDGHRNGLRKKMGLKPNDNLRDFLQGIR